MTSSAFGAGEGAFHSALPDASLASASISLACHVLAPARTDGEIVHGLDVALFRRRRIPGPSAAQILVHALSALIEDAEPILRRGKAGARGAFEPAAGFAHITRRAFALRVAKRDRILRLGIARCRGLTQGKGAKRLWRQRERSRHGLRSVHGLIAEARAVNSEGHAW